MVLRKTSEPPKRNNNNFAHNESLQIKACGESAPFSHIENLYTSSWKKRIIFYQEKQIVDLGKVHFKKKEKRKKFASLSGNRQKVKVNSLSRVQLFGDRMNCSPPGSSLHGILQARILEWVAVSFSRGSSRPRDRTRVSRIPGRCFNR